MRLEGYLQKCNLSSVHRVDSKIILSRLLLDNYEVNTWLSKDGTLKVEVSKNGQRCENRIIVEDTLENILNEYGEIC